MTAIFGNIDSTQSPEQILTALINRENGLNLNAMSLVFGAVQINTSGSKNSRIQVSAAAGSGFSGSVVVTYNRVNMTAIAGTESTTFSANNASRVIALLPAINARFGINLSNNDIIDAALPVFTGNMPGETKSFELAASASSKLFVGSITLQLLRQDIALSTVITDTSIDTVFP